MGEPPLAAYENQQITGASFGNEDFQDCLKRSLPEHHQFKGFPTCFGTSDIDEIWKELKAGDVPADIIATSGEYVNFALRIKVHIFPEDICATWLMLAVRFLPK